MVHHARPNLNKWNKKSANLEQKWHCLVDPLKHTNLPILSNTAGKLTCWPLSHPHHCLKDEERESLPVNTHPWAGIGLNIVKEDPLAPGLPKYPWWHFLPQHNDDKCLQTGWRQWEAKNPPPNKVQLELEVCINLLHVPLEIWHT